VALAGLGSTPVAGTTKVLLQPVAASVVKTTIDPRVEAAAKSAVQAHPNSSMVVIQPSTGDILAVANNDGANDFALTARVAPGSTNKIITSTALFTAGLVSSPAQSVGCPQQLVINGNTFKNDSGESEPPSTPFITDFAASCNNAFARWYSSLGASALAQTAQRYYGLNQQWDIGIGPGGPYYSIPATAYNGELAQELFGQGSLAASPLAMASVAATVDTGSFKQPVVVPGQAQLGGTPLPATVHQYLWQMMRAVTQSGGTAAGVFNGVGSPVYAKTGTADVGGQGQPNSWMVAFDPTLDVAIACVVLNAGHGATVAGPEVAAALQRLSR
jgi:cell division protein FtsI/penicillin-binding protein 2